MLPSRGVIRAAPSLGLGSSNIYSFMRIRTSKLPSSPKSLPTTRSFGTSLRTNNASRLRLHTGGAPAGLALGSRLGLAPSMAALSLPVLRQQQLRNASWWNPVSYVPNSVNPWGSKPDQSPPTSAAEPPPPTSDAATEVANAAASSSTSSASDAAQPFSSSVADEISKLSQEFSNPEMAAMGMDVGQREELLDIPETIGFLHQLGLDYGWGPSSMCQWFLEHLHVYSGMEWWGTLAAAAVLFRVVFFKFTMDSMEMSAKFTTLTSHPRFKQAMAEMLNAQMAGDNALAAKYQQELTSMRRVYGTTMRPMLLNFATIPIGFGFFRVIRGMCDIPVPSLETGGLFWFTDLSVPDPYYLLPIFSGLGLVALFKSTPAPSARGAAMQKTLAWVLTPVMVLVSLRLAAGLQWFFVVTGVVSTLLNILRRQPWFRVALGYPAELPQPPKTDPYGSSSSARPRPGGMSYQAPTSPTDIGTPSNPYVLPKSQTILKDGTGPDGMPKPPSPSSSSLLDKMGISPAIKEMKATFKEAKGDTNEKVEAKLRRKRQEKAETYEEKRRMEEEDASRARREAKRIRKGHHH